MLLFSERQMGEAAMLKGAEAQQSWQRTVTRGMMDAAGTALTRQRARAWGGDGPSAHCPRVAVPAQSSNRGDDEAGEERKKSEAGAQEKQVSVQREH